jgi:pimeloyl-ACP methyl ester carboxylesterase
MEVSQPDSRPGPQRRHAVLFSLAIVALAAVSTSSVVSSSTGTALAANAAGVKPTIVLVHGAWADSSSWARVIARLQDDNYPVVALANPLRGLSTDAAYVRDFLNGIYGPVVLVGHSYGGAVITNAARNAPSVRALVYVDAFIPRKGESIVQLASARPGSCLAGDPATVFNFVPYPGAPPGDFDLYVKTERRPSFPGFARCFANDLPPREGAILAATQRPITLSAGTEPSGAPAWRMIPSWALVGTADRVLPPAEQAFMARRADAHIVRVRTSHLSPISHPHAVTALIVRAARATS